MCNHAAAAYDTCMMGAGGFVMESSHGPFFVSARPPDNLNPSQREALGGPIFWLRMHVIYIVLLLMYTYQTLIMKCYFWMSSKLTRFRFRSADPFAALGYWGGLGLAGRALQYR
jgi:hypothetical protein